MNNINYLEHKLAEQTATINSLYSVNSKIKEKCDKLEAKVETQRRELKRLNNIHDRAKEFANVVLSEIYISKDSYIYDLEEKIEALRRKEEYYENKINELLTQINELRGNKDE